MTPALNWNAKALAFVADPLFVPVDGKTIDWPRKVANAINAARRALSDRSTVPFEMLAANPSSPVEGQTYYNTATHKVRTWDGSAWQNHW